MGVTIDFEVTYSCHSSMPFFRAGIRREFEQSGGLDLIIKDLRMIYARPDDELELLINSLFEHPSVGSCLPPVMINIPASRDVLIGSTSEEIEEILREFDGELLRSWIDKQGPQFKTTIGNFKIGKYPVTNFEYALFLKENPYEKPPSGWSFARINADRLFHPAATVPHDAAERYCRWISVRTGRKFRLPREFEWEYVASGGDGRRYPWGNEWSASRANTVEAGLGITSPVFKYDPVGASPFGCVDMAGNVEEWMGEKFFLYEGTPGYPDAHYYLEEDYRPTRGGSFLKQHDLAMCARRHGQWKGVVGFRLVEQI